MRHRVSASCRTIAKPHLLHIGLHVFDGKTSAVDGPRRGRAFGDVHVVAVGIQAARILTDGIDASDHFSFGQECGRFLGLFDDTLNLSTAPACLSKQIARSRH